MSSNRQDKRKLFSDTAKALIEEVYSSKWDNIDYWHTPIEEWSEVLAEYELRCPSYSRNDYIDALRRAQWNNR